jgi:hypothetical protein
LGFVVQQGESPPERLVDISEAQPRAGCGRSHVGDVNARQVGRGVEERELQQDGVMVLVLKRDDPLNVEVEESLG